MTQPTLTTEKIISAQQHFSDLIKETPLEFNQRLSKKYACKVYLKREDQQPIRSYKLRGAFNAIRLLTPLQKKKGIVCASAGNHAQGVAISCKHFQMSATIFMPLTTPEQKIKATKKFGGKFVTIVLEGDTFDSSYQTAVQFCKKNKSQFIHPFDDINVIAGQGTVGYEILHQIKHEIDYVFVPVGGGGLIAGVGFYFNETSPHSKIVGVEPAGAPSMKESLSANKVVDLPNVNPFVDGASVGKIGQKAFNTAKQFVKHIEVVPEDRLCSTMVEFLQEDGIILEPAGALSIDALKNHKTNIKGKTVVCVVSGGNFDFERMLEVKERSLRYEGLKRYYSVIFPQRAGALREFLTMLGPKDNIVRFEYIRKAGTNRAPVIIGIESESRKNIKTLEARMSKSPFEFTDITQSQLFLND